MRTGMIRDLVLFLLGVLFGWGALMTQCSMCRGLSAHVWEKLDALEARLVALETKGAATK